MNDTNDMCKCVNGAPSVTPGLIRLTDENRDLCAKLSTAISELGAILLGKAMNANEKNVERPVQCLMDSELVIREKLIDALDNLSAVIERMNA